MERRKFIKRFGAGASTLSVLPGLAQANSKKTLPEFQYKYPKTVEAAKNEEGLVAIRIAFTSKNTFLEQTFGSQIVVKKGKLARTRAFHFESSDKFNPEKDQFSVLPNNGNQDVLAVWIDQATGDTSVTLKGKEGEIRFSLQDLIDQPEATGSIEEIDWTANILLYHEVGAIDPATVGIKVDGNDFNFVAMADSQGGDAFAFDELRTRMRIHNAFVEESAALVNKLPFDPAYTIVIGDITDHQGAAEDFVKMNEFLKKINTPLLYSIGNHESRYNSRFTPGYNMESLNNYFAAQKEINGLEKLLYSYNLGEWHFVVWPDPLRRNFFETHPHYFDWLEKDLEKHKDRPTMFFQHVPIHPIGINPLINYMEDLTTKKEVLNVLKKFGNVKYVLSGHVHIPVKASFKTAITMGGIKFINLPAAGYRPRAFGEEDYNGGPSQGIAIVEIKGKEANITFQTVTLEEYQYPDTLPELDEQLYSLDFNEKWEIPSTDQFINGSFEQGLKGWGRRFLYMEDENPSNICEPRKMAGNSPTSLYLFNKIRGHHKPGEDRWPQNLNRTYQAIKVQSGAIPGIRFSYQVDQENSNVDGLCGAYLLAEGYYKTTKQFNIMYCIGKAWFYVDNPTVDPAIALDITSNTKGWNSVDLNLADDFNQFDGNRQFKDLKINRIIVTAGVWTANDGQNKSFGVYLDDFSYNGNRSGKSSVNSQGISVIPRDQQWFRRTTHVAGEHWYIKDQETRFS